MTWTRFWAMHSGGEQKLKYSELYIEGKEDEAKEIFEKKFGYSCCGEDYEIKEFETLEEATLFHRVIRPISIDEYINRMDVFVIRKREEKVISLCNSCWQYTTKTPCPNCGED